MSFRRYKEVIIGWIDNLNESYEPTEDKPLVKIAELTLILPALGIFYLWQFFDHFGIHYFLYFDLKDSLAILYGNMMPVIYMSVFFSLIMTILISDMLRKRPNNNISEESQNEAEIRNKRKKLSKISIWFVLFIVVVGFGVLLKTYQFQPWVILMFCGIAGFSGYLYLFEHKNLGFGVAVVLVFIYMMVVAKNDAQSTLEKKAKFNIVLKNHSDLPILTEKNPCLYFIYKTSGYYFIKDDCENLIYAYSVSTGEMTSFTP